MEATWEGGQLSSEQTLEPTAVHFPWYSQLLPFSSSNFVVVILFSFYSGSIGIGQKFSVWICSLLTIRITYNIKIDWFPTVLVIHYYITNYPNLVVKQNHVYHLTDFVHWLGCSDSGAPMKLQSSCWLRQQSVQHLTEEGSTFLLSCWQASIPHHLDLSRGCLNVFPHDIWLPSPWGCCMTW